MRRGNFSHVLASPEAMAARFPEHPEAVAETRELAARLRFDLSADLGYRYPGSDDEQALSKLAELCWARLGERYPAGHQHVAAAHARLEEELRVIDSLGLAGFFLLHRDLLELAREVAVEVRGPSSVRALLPPGRGRGSSVSSIVCYLTGLSHIDPVSNELFLGRFLNEELTALPDIDLDFPRDIRAVLIPRVHERYGRERSALVAAFPTFRSRGAIRELGKVLGLPPGELERLARGAEPWAVRGVAADVETALGLEPGGPPAPFVDMDNRAPFAMSTGEWLAMVGGHDPADIIYTEPPSRISEERYNALPGRWEWLARLCDQAYGLPRHLSQHSGGMIVSTRPLIDCCPVLPAAMEGRQLCQWDKDSCADAGFLKIDLLGLGMLSAVERCVEMIARVRGERVDLSRIPFDDKATYDAIQTADTMGVFQIESRAQMQSLYRTRPQSLDDLTIQVAIVRPGPILGGAVNPYISRLQQLREDPDYVVPYEHPSLEAVLHDTLGTIIFQDQVIEVAMAFAGFSPGEAEGLRRAMSRKRSAAAIEAYHQRFLDGAAATHGVDAEIAERVYTMIVGFSGFGFPKAHGAAFGLLAYQSTWLRVHYGPEFLCGLLNEQPMGFYAPDTLAHEAQRRGIELAPADVNASEVECTVEEVGPPARVRIGLGYVLGVRADEVEALVEARRERGPFRSLADLASRAGAGRPALEKLAWAGACDALAVAVGTARRPPTATPAAPRCGSSASPRPGERVRLGHAALPAARGAGGPGPAGARPVGGDGGRLRHHRPHARPAPARAAAPQPARRHRHVPGPRAPPARDAGADRRPRRGAPAAGDGQGDRLHPARGRVRHDQPDRAAAGLRAPPADRPHRAADHGRGAARAAAAGGRRHQRLRAPPARAGHARGRRRRRGRARRAPGRRGGRRRGRRGPGARHRAERRRGGRRGRLPGRRAGRPELRRGAQEVRDRQSSTVGTVRFPPRMTTLIFVLVWVVLGLGLLFIALSGGPSGATEQLMSTSRAGRRVAIVLFAISLVVLGFVIPAAVVRADKNKDDIPEANVSDLTESEKHGRELFGLRCANCHTLQAANAIAQVGPNLDQIRPNKATVLNAIENGKSAGNGQMARRALHGRGRRGRRQLRRQGRRRDRGARLGGRVGRLRGRVGRVVRRLIADTAKVHFRTLHGRFREPPEQVLTYAPLR